MSSSDVKLPLYHESEANKGGSLREDTDPRNVTSAVEQKKMWPGELNDFLSGATHAAFSAHERSQLMQGSGVGRIHHHDLDHAQFVRHPPERLDPVSPSNPAAPYLRRRLPDVASPLWNSPLFIYGVLMLSLALPRRRDLKFN